MSDAELLIEEIKTLPENITAEVLDFVGYLKEKAAKNADNSSLRGTDTESAVCPICAAHRDPVTGEERFNAETIAAFEEGDAMLRGEIPAQRFNSIEELLADLRS